MAPKAQPSAKGGGKQSIASILQGKPYKEAINEVFASTSVQARDIDQKAVQLLDAYQKVGKAEEGCQHLKTSLEGLPREKVSNWRAYVYKLLRDFDKDTYNEMKEKSGGNRRQGGKAKGSLNGSAPEFNPGQWWSGDSASGALATPVTMGYPMNAMMMQQVMPKAAAAPPPPPQQAAVVAPKAAPEGGATAPAATPEAPATEAAPAAAPATEAR